MTPADIRAAIAASPALQALVPDTYAIAEALSAGRTRASSRTIGNGAVLEAIGLAAGNALLDAIEAQPAFRHVRPLLEQGRLIAASPLVAGALAQLVAAGVISQAHADALLALGREPDPVAAQDVQAALDEAIEVTRWRAEFVGVPTDGANLRPRVRYCCDATGETIVEDVPANDITADRLREHVALRLRQLEIRDRARATFEGLQPGGAFDPFA